MITKKIVGLKDDLSVVLDYFREGEATEEEVKQLESELVQCLEAIEFRNMLSDEGDDLSAVIQVTAGAGGTESCDWAQMLIRMYMMWSKKQGYKLKELNYQEGDVAGVKTVTLEVNGDLLLAISRAKMEYIVWCVFLLLIATPKDTPPLHLFMSILW